MDVLKKTTGSRLTSFITATTFILAFASGITSFAHDDSLPGTANAPNHTRENMKKFAESHHHNEHLAAQSITTCEAGMAGAYPCSNIDLMAFLPTSQIGGGNGNDIWGWTDPLSGKEYAIMGLTSGTAFVDISDPVNPLFLGHLPPHPGVSGSSWRDIKTYDNYAYIGSEANNSSMQVVDLTQLRDITTTPMTIVETAFYTGFSTSHNIVINEDSGFAYAVGTNTGNCGRGLHFIDLINPASPVAAGCFSADGYTHDAQCVNYTGPDTDHQGKEICFAYNEDTLTIVDVSNKSAPVQLSRLTYTNEGYSHQGWLTEDHAYLLMDDELDEYYGYESNTRTLIWNVSDLDNPAHEASYSNPSTTSIDHNQYIVGNYSYQANYESGLRILDISDIANGNLVEAAYFDIYLGADTTDFNGAWSVYPFFASGNVIVSGIGQGLYILRPNLGSPNTPPVVDLLNPAEGSDLSNTVQIRINATDFEDADGTLDVEWKLDDGAWQPTSYSSPDFIADWDTTTATDGAHMITARAVDSGLAEGGDINNVTTNNGPQMLKVDAVIVTIDSGRGNRNTGTATIMVSDTDNNPVPDALVDTIFSGGWDGARSGNTDNSGEASVSTPRVKGLSFVQVCVDAVTKAGWALDTGASNLCGDSNGGGSAFGTVDGTVTDSATTAGISNAAVSTDTGQSGNTDAFGNYSLGSVPVGNRTISVTASGYQSQNQSTTVNDGATATVDFALNETSSGGAGAIKGTVFSGAGGKLGGVTVQVLGGTASNTNKGGKYTIQNVPSGLQTVIASKAGFMSQQQNVNVVAGGTVNLNFTLTPE